MTLPVSNYLPPRARALLTRRIAARNALDRSLATARGIPADSPDCARFQGPGAHDALDREARRLARAFVPGVIISRVVTEGAS